MLEDYLPPPWLLFMMTTSVVALIASFFVFKENKRLEKEINERIATKKAAEKLRALGDDGDKDLPAHG